MLRRTQRGRSAVERRNMLRRRQLPLAADLAEAGAPEQAVHVDAIDPRRARRGADVVVVQGEQLLEVLALEPPDPALALDAERLGRVDARAGRLERGGERRRFVEREAALDVVAQLADVAGPAVALELGE